MTEVVVTLTVTNTEQTDSHISLLTKVPDIENKESVETIITRIINSNKVEQHWIGGHIKEIKIVDFNKRNHHYFVAYEPTKFDYLLISAPPRSSFNKTKE
jgi:hypothetical protein